MLDLNKKSALNALLEKNKDTLTKVTQTSTGDKFEELPEGFYLCELLEATLGESKSGKLMASMRFKVVEDGRAVLTDDQGNAQFGIVEHSTNRNIFNHYVLEGDYADKKLKQLKSDCLKFEGSDGNPLLPEEAFNEADLLEQCMDALVGSRIYIQVSYGKTANEDGSPKVFYNLITFAKAKDMELPL